MSYERQFELTSVSVPPIRTEIQPGDYVSISASRYPFASVLPSGNRSREWIKSISSTLQWNERRRQRPFDAEKDLDEAYERERKSSRTSDLCD